MSSGAARTVQLAGDTDSDGFRRACRVLMRDGVAPDQVTWIVAGDDADLFAATPDLPHDDAPPLRMPAWFGLLCDAALLHREPARFALLYRLAWRLQHEPGLRDDPLDADRVHLEHLQRAVRRDMHKMKAFVRFRTITVEGSATPLHVAWFEPEHHTVPATAPFFMRRFAQMHWAILTPECCVRWDGAALEFGPGASRADAPAADAGEALWLTYYRNIFNPARLKLKMMQKEMPKRYWKNLPEAVLIDELTTAAAPRTAAMLAAEGTVPARRVPQLPTVRAAPPAAAPTTLAQLRDAVDRCRACPLGALATQGVAGEGPLRARLMFVGEQPGDQEDLRGRPFVGPAGQLFDRAMGHLGWARDQVFVSNAVKHFKYELRGKRRIHKTPAQQEAAACLDWLEREIDLVQPEALVALGATAARSLLGRPVAVLKERGHWLQRADGRRVLVTLHPSALLRADPADRDAGYARWLDDLRAAAPFAPRVSAGPGGAGVGPADTA